MLNPYDEISLEGAYSEKTVMQCPFCKSMLSENDDIYTMDGEAIGCEWCVDCENVYEFVERRSDGESADGRSFLFPA